MRKTMAFVAGMLALPVFALGAQTRGGLTKVELLALQQEMRDQDCGNKHAAGEWNAETKAAIRTCAKRHNTSTNAKELLAAMNIGFSAGDTPPAGGGMKGDDMAGMKMEGDMKGMKMSGEAKEEMKESPGAEKAEKKAAMKKGMKMKGEMKKMHDDMMKKDSTKKD